MIDTKLLIDDFDETVRRLARKGVDRALPEEARRLADERRRLVQQVDTARRERKEVSEGIGQLMKEGKKEEAAQARAATAEAGSRLEALESELREVEGALEDV